MKKNIVLIDTDLSLIKSISESKKINVELLITDADDKKIAEIKNLYRVNNIITRDFFNNYLAQKEIDLDYKVIEKFRYSQLNSEHDQDRWSTDNNLKQYFYFNALFFWFSFFSNNSISAVVNNGLFHGANYDSLALDVAKYFGISGYVIDIHMERYTEEGIVSVRSVINYNKKKRIPLDINELNLKPIIVDDFLFSVEKISKFLKKKRKSLKDRIKYLLPSYSSSIIHILGYVISSRLIRHHGLNTSPLIPLKNIFYVRKLRKFYDSIAVELDTSKKSIFYALHFEPEASIMARAKLSNQLYIIKQLSQNLPSGWILYVKEHPHQFKLYMPGWWYYLTSIYKYRTKEFYKEILKFDNVKLLKLSMKSQDIIKSTDAISTINGSIASEAISYNKPLILFGHQSTPFGLCKDTFKITSKKQCKNAIEKIADGFIPEYSDFSEICENYLFEHKELAANNVQLLIEYLVFEYENPSND